MLWRRLTGGIDAASLLDAATLESVVFVAGPSFYPDAAGGAGRHDLRLAFAGLPPSAIDDGIRRLAGVLERVSRYVMPGTGSTPIQ